jgi:hypothetical protein
MTKSQEKGENEITDEAKRDRERKIKRAEKYLGCRYKRKRGNMP